MSRPVRRRPAGAVMRRSMCKRSAAGCARCPRETPPRGEQQADHEVRAALEVKKVSGMCQNSVIYQQRQDQILFGRNRRDTQHGIPPAVGLQHRAARLVRDALDQVPVIAGDARLNLLANDSARRAAAPPPPPEPASTPTSRRLRRTRAGRALQRRAPAARPRRSSRASPAAARSISRGRPARTRATIRRAADWRCRRRPPAS